MSYNDSSIWNDPVFASTETEMMESPWLNYTTLGEADSPSAGYGLRTPSKADAVGQQTAHDFHTGGNSSHDSSSDTSSGRKRKSVSESPVDSKMQTNEYPQTAGFEPPYHQGMHNLAVDHSMSNTSEDFFNSAASSPNLPRDFNQQLSLDANMGLANAQIMPQFTQAPSAIVNPGQVFPASRDQSPAMFNTVSASPNAVFSTPSSDSNDFASNPKWNTAMPQNPAWPSEFGNQLASPGFAFTPSPAAHVSPLPMASNRSPLHIGPINAKSRVETQINVTMTLERPPPGIEYLHLPLHTIAKSKLLSKEDYDMTKVLELHTMLVCTSAMHNAAAKDRALQRAAAQDNAEIQRRAELHRNDGEEIKNETKNLAEDEKPANGGEVKICNNCIQRERKRAGRKKLKKEEEQQHWERFETARVVVFNSQEHIAFKPAERSRESAAAAGDTYVPPDGAISASAQMRIACYCRHQQEKDGFQVIFTLKDHNGNVVAQAMSDSILITDDHKTHPPQFSTAGDLVYQHPQLSQNGIHTSYSMVDFGSYQQPFTSSRSAGNLQALNYPQSHVHQMPNSGYMSQTTSATMTPTSLSRPGSPTIASQTGPNKKRKSSSFHRRLPSGLQMTPRVDTSQPPSANPLSGMTMGSNFSPTGTAFAQADQSYMTIPNNGGAGQFFSSNPSTPANEQTGFAFGAAHQLDINRGQNAAAYFSHPSSAVPSRSGSPVLQHNRTISGYTRQPLQTPLQTTTNHIGRAGQFYNSPVAPGAANEQEQQPLPTITKITPASGPTSGGTEVGIFGWNFTHNTQIMFGDRLANSTFYGEQSMLAISPPAARAGNVRVRIVPTQRNAMPYTTPQSNSTVFTYHDSNPEMMEMALRFLTAQQGGDQRQWMQYANEVANQFMQTNLSPATDRQDGGYTGG